MTVGLRVRPLSGKETANGHRAVVNTVDEDNICSISKLERMGAVLQSERGQIHTYEFDRVFGSEASNEQVYESTVRNLIPKVLMGINCTIFAYGSTGAGKTHTIMGYSQDPGMMPRSMIDLFAAIEASEEPSRFSVQVSYMEVYCETIRDLLSDSDKPLNPCERASDGSVQVLGLTERDVVDVNEVLALVAEGSHRRKTEPTAANEVSSRSHAVLQVSVTKSTPNPNFRPLARKALSGKSSVRIVAAEEPFIKRSARLSLIDLAGSERAAATQNKGVRLREGANINKSLLALANCINALSSNGNARVKYRDSKLTHILKSSLEGDCRVVMLAAINPSHKSYEESHNTLKYAYRAKNIKSSVTAISIAQQQAAAALKSFPELTERDASSSGSLLSFEEDEGEGGDVFNEDDEEEENAAPMLQAIRNVFFAPQLASPPPSHQQPRSKVMKMTSKESFEDDVEEEYQEEETLQDERDRVLEENLELKLELSKAKELIALLQQQQQKPPMRLSARPPSSRISITRLAASASKVPLPPKLLVPAPMSAGPKLPPPPRPNPASPLPARVLPRYQAPLSAARKRPLSATGKL